MTQERADLGISGECLLREVPMKTKRASEGRVSLFSSFPGDY
jgi:hypothetical protein